MNLDKCNDVEILLSRAYWNALRSWSVIDSFRSVAKAGLPSALQIIDQQNTDWASTTAIHSMFPEDDTVSMWKKYTEQCANSAQYSVDAASIVFGHSLMDEATLECSYVCQLPFLMWSVIIDISPTSAVRCPKINISALLQSYG